ncbi:hypothetical protein WDU94_007470 [Cyamophila willieti]
MSAGVPQGSLGGPTLWNCLYDGVLRLNFPQNVQLVAFADDLAVVVVAKTDHELEQLTNDALEKIHNWMSDNQLQIAPEKSEAVLLSGKKKCAPLNIHICGQRIHVKKEVKYLGVILDSRLSFKPHITYVTEKADRTQPHWLIYSLEQEEQEKTKEEFCKAPLTLSCSMLHLPGRPAYSTKHIEVNRSDMSEDDHEMEVKFLTKKMENIFAYIQAVFDSAQKIGDSSQQASFKKKVHSMESLVSQYTALHERVALLELKAKPTTKMNFATLDTVSDMFGFIKYTQEKLASAGKNLPQSSMKSIN